MSLGKLNLFVVYIVLLLVIMISWVFSFGSYSSPSFIPPLAQASRLCLPYSILFKQQNIILSIFSYYNLFYFYINLLPCFCYFTLCHLRSITFTCLKVDLAILFRAQLAQARRLRQLENSLELF